MRPTVALVACVGMLCIAGMEVCALLMGHDGAILVSSVAAVGIIAGGAIGYRVGQK